MMGLPGEEKAMARLLGRAVAKGRILKLILAVNGCYFDQIKAGSKVEEYRLTTDYWRKRLEGRSYHFVEITRGYPRRDDHSRRLLFKWSGYRRAMLVHPHFGADPVEVFAIDLRERAGGN